MFHRSRTRDGDKDSNWRNNSQRNGSAGPGPRPRRFNGNENGGRDCPPTSKRSRTDNRTGYDRRQQHDTNTNEGPSTSGYHRKRYEEKQPRKFYVGFKYIENLLKNPDLEKTLLTLSKDKNGFNDLLNTNPSNDVVVLIVKLLSKICDSDFPEIKIQLLQVALLSAFIENLRKFIATIPSQSTKEKHNNKYFWNETDEFWKDVIKVCRSIYDLIPKSSCEKIILILKTLKLCIPLIESEHRIHVSDEIKENVNTLHDVLENALKEVELKRARNEYVEEAIELEPPDDFREISVYPTIQEITTQEKPFLRPNVVQGPYRDPNHYLDVQFRLLREDFVAPLRKGICSYLSKSKQRLEDIKVYKRVHFLGTETVNEQNCYRIQYDFSGKKKSFKYENSRKFMYGSLLCFTSNNFKTVIFGKIVQRDVKDLEKGHLIVGFNHDVTIPEDIFDSDYVMVESKVFFEPYHQVLNVLKRISINEFPMERYIIRVEPEADPPRYLLNINPIFYQIERYDSFWPLDWPDKKFYDLNESQHVAFKAAITQEFSIIQGPPGTGKTFLGLKIARTLLENKSAWFNRTPMLVICFTNHALDQFLEGLLNVTKNIIRVGSQSKNEKLNKYNIRHRKHIDSGAEIRHMWHQVRSHLEEIKKIKKILDEIESNEVVVNFSVFVDVIPGFVNSWFSTSSKQDILNWLFDSQEEPQGPIERNQIAEDFQNINENAEENEEVDVEVEELNNDDRMEIADDIFEDIIMESSSPLVTVRNLFVFKKQLTDDLIHLQHNTEMTHLQKMIKREGILLELAALERNSRYLQFRLTEAARGGFRGKPDYVDMKNPHLMTPRLRWHLYFHWLEQYKTVLLRRREVLGNLFQNDYKLYSEMRDIQDTQIMKQALVVGMTTTAAARLKSSLLTLKSPIVIVEEAAEVLEAHIICSLTNHCQHLILIGDHQQLRPSTANFAIETKYLLGISLFERMIKNKIQCHTLNIQHRMRPEISKLICPTIYPVLIDHESVMDRPSILGVENCIYFIDHQEFEELCNDSSKKNVHEAKFLINLAKHLVLNGYEPGKITILAAYLGQMFEMARQKQQYNFLLQDVKICVLDNYQGEENDIILLSLVRSNNENKIGFLKNENRVCVALSRAKNGFYMMGDMKHLCKNSTVWNDINDVLKSQNAIGPSLTLRCQIHKQQLTSVKTAEDFMQVPEGGCSLLCGTVLNCSHICKSLCHITNRDHSSYRCLEKCPKTLCDNEQHICKKLCYEECGPCSYPVVHNLSCGHTVTIACSIDPATYDCEIQIKSVLPCGHEVDKPCFRNPETFICPEPCDVRVEPCGHACERKCHIRDDPDHLQYKCRKPCPKPKVGCNLPGEHICTKFCFEDCEDCNISIKKHRTVCPHVYNVPCRVHVDEIQCKKPCTKMLPCGHKCKNPCDEPCGNCQVKVDKILVECGHTVKVKCCEEPIRELCNGKCPRLLPCGHVCDKKCKESCTTNCKSKADCSIESPCGHIVKKIMCALKNTDDPKVLLQYCTEKCSSKLKCGHICKGSCGECAQSRIHQRCKEKCGSTLICNHECPIPCSQACKPCQQDCSYKCSHNRCNRKCGDPCNSCKEPCTRTCRHQRCTKLCGEICNVPPCSEPCMKVLNCGHPCVGFCSDPCPVLCKICNYDELTEIFLGNEDEEDAVYVMLEECKHVFESGDLETWLQSGSEIMAKSCPRCKTSITGTKRYSDYLKTIMIDINNVKKRSNGSHKENNELRNKLLADIEKLQQEAKFKVPDLEKVIEILTNRLEHTVKQGSHWRRQAINKIDLDIVQSKLQILDLIQNVLYKEERSILLSTIVTTQVSFIVKALIREQVHITQQEIEDISLEIERLSRIIQYVKIKGAPDYYQVKSKEDVKRKMENIEKLLLCPRRYSNITDAILQTDLIDLSKIVAATVKITEVEKRQIVAALGMKKGHWFKCPNGHLYIITECGGANQISKCNECGERIGGENHRLLPGQSHAREMDDSLHPAWSDAANMVNYEL